MKFLRVVIFLSIAILGAEALQGQAPAPTAAEYLGLTPDQVALFTRNRKDNVAGLEALRTRWRSVIEEILAEMERKPQDPLAIGLRYAELETMSREYAERTIATIARHQSLLNPNQAGRLQSLLAAGRLSSFEVEAACLYLSDKYFDENSTNFCHRYPYLRSVLVRAEKNGSRRMAGHRTALEEFLQLTPEQIAHYRAIQKRFTDWETGEYAARGRAVNGEACRALASSPLEPLRIGLAIIGLDRLFTERTERSLELIAANQALLTNEQRGRLRILEDARDLSPLTQWAEAEGFFQRGEKNINLHFNWQLVISEVSETGKSQGYIHYPYCYFESAP